MAKFSGYSSQPQHTYLVQYVQNKREWNLNIAWWVEGFCENIGQCLKKPAYHKARSIRRDMYQVGEW